MSHQIDQNDAPFGLPNVGNSCWLNAVIQLLIRSGNFVNSLFQNRNKGFILHDHFCSLIVAIDEKNTNDILKHYVNLYQTICKLHPNFVINGQNDSHEVYTYLINALHDESKVMLPDDIIERSDKSDFGSQAVLRDYNKSVSHILETTLLCTLRHAKDGDRICETYNTLFIEPPPNSEGEFNIQDSLNLINFLICPKVLMLNVFMNENARCRLTNEITITSDKGIVIYRLCGIIFYIQQMHHYIAAVKKIDNIGWYILNDNMCNFIDSNELFKYIKAYPSLISYEKCEIV